MKVVLAAYGTRGDTEPFAAVARELLRRGHDATFAVAPDMVGFVERAGLAAIPFGPGSLAAAAADSTGTQMDQREYLSRAMAEWGNALTTLSRDADVLLTGRVEQRLAANVAEYHDIPHAALHFYPQAHLRQRDWVGDVMESAEEDHRRALGLPDASDHVQQAVEIQAYEALWFPEVAAQRADADVRRPFVGALTLELPTDADDEVLSWITAGTPPIYFGFGSGVWLQNPAHTFGLISVACSRLGERALICTGASDFAGFPPSNQYMVVGAINHATVFPACRAVVHQGGAGTTAAGLRAGVPSLILWHPVNDQQIWGDAVARLKVGGQRAFSASNLGSLVADLRSVLEPECVARARAGAASMTEPARSAAHTADLLEQVCGASPTRDASS